MGVWVLFLVVSFSLQGARCLDVKLGIILPEEGSREFSLKRVLPAIYYAVESVNKSGILPGCDIQVLVKDSECSATMGPLAAVDFHIYHNVSAFIGPVCDYAVAPVARFASFWNTPVLTAGAIAAAFGNKTEYDQLTRVYGAYSNKVDLFLSIAQTFNWTNIGFMFHDRIATKGGGRSSCFFRIEGIFTMLHRTYGKVPWVKKFDERFPFQNEIDKMLRAMSENVRSE